MSDLLANRPLGKLRIAAAQGCVAASSHAEDHSIRDVDCDVPVCSASSMVWSCKEETRTVNTVDLLDARGVSYCTRRQVVSIVRLQMLLRGHLTYQVPKSGG